MYILREIVLIFVAKKHIHQTYNLQYKEESLSAGDYRTANSSICSSCLWVPYIHIPGASVLKTCTGAHVNIPSLTCFQEYMCHNIYTWLAIT